MNKKYVISKVRRVGGVKGYYHVWVLAEYSLPDEQGIFQQVKSIAEFGNTKHKENYQNAKLLKNAMEQKG